MNFKITKDQNYCCFGDNIVYEFVSESGFYATYSCVKCSFYRSCDLASLTLKCSVVPCQKPHRHDKNDGFWQISKAIDYQQFKQMLQKGG